MQIACTLDVSQRGACLTGVKGLKGPGQIIAVRRNASEARFRVAWIGRPRTPQEGRVGIECLDPGKIIWDVDFAKAEEDFEPLETTTLGKAANPESYSCFGTVRVWAEDLASQCIEARLTAIGLSGCQLGSAEQLLMNSQLLLEIHIGETSMTFKGVLRQAGVALGVRVEFTHIRRGDYRVLQSLVVQLSRGKRDGVESQPVEEACGPEHICLLYTSSEEQLAAVVPFVRAGLRRGERCLYIADDKTTATIDA